MESAATAMSVYLCVRNVIGGMGPLAIAQISSSWDLQHALELLPIMYVLSGGMFYLAEHFLQPGACGGGGSGSTGCGNTGTKAVEVRAT